MSQNKQTKKIGKRFEVDDIIPGMPTVGQGMFGQPTWSFLILLLSPSSYHLRDLSQGQTNPLQFLLYILLLIHYYDLAFYVTIVSDYASKWT